MQEEGGRVSGGNADPRRRCPCSLLQVPISVLVLSAASARTSLSKVCHDSILGKADPTWIRVRVPQPPRTWELREGDELVLWGAA